MKKLSPTMVSLIMLALVILLFRLLYVDVYIRLQQQYGFTLADYFYAFMSNIAAVLVSLLLDAAFIIVINRKLGYGRSPLKRILITMLFLILVSVVGTLLVTKFYSLPWYSPQVFYAEFLTCFMAVLLVNFVVVLMADLIYYLRNKKLALAAQENKTRKAQYQYSQLKQQLNPHFLFNSLNILDYLVQNEDRERASDFIRKLAGIYRYLLSQGDKRVVPLEEEVAFCRMYTDLLRERFPAGLEVDYRILSGDMNALVVPCGVQVLIENAIKHNVVNTATPLRIEIFTDRRYLVVRNRLQPRLSKTESHGVGLSNIREQYLDAGGVDIIVNHTEEEFVVKLPLL